MKKLLIIIFFVLFAANAWAGNKYIDILPTATNCETETVNTDYDPATRTCGGGSDTVFIEPADHSTPAFYYSMRSNRTAKGDTLYFRAGTYALTDTVAALAAGTGGALTILPYAGETVTIYHAGTSSGMSFLTMDVNIGAKGSKFYFTNPNSVVEAFFWVRAGTFNIVGNEFDFNNAAPDAASIGAIVRQVSASTSAATIINFTDNKVKNVAGSLTAVIYTSEAYAGHDVTVTAKRNEIYNVTGFIRRSESEAHTSNLTIMNNTLVDIVGNAIYDTSTSTIGDYIVKANVYYGGAAHRFMSITDTITAAMTNSFFPNIQYNMIYSSQLVSADDFGRILYSTTYAPNVDATNRLIAPGFNNYAGGDFSLAATSNAAARGTTISDGSTDINGNAWTGNDVGCYSNSRVPVAGTPLTLILTPGLIAFMGDSLMEGEGGTGWSTTCTNCTTTGSAWYQFAAMTGLTVQPYVQIASGAHIPARSGLSVPGLFWYADFMLFNVKPSTAFVAIGVNSMNHSAITPTNENIQTLANITKTAIQKLVAHGVTPIWLGSGSTLPAVGQYTPDNDTYVKPFNTAVEVICAANGWKYGSFLERMEFNAAWKNRATLYYGRTADANCLCGTVDCTAGGTACTQNVHPGDLGYTIVASLAENLYYGRSAYHVADIAYSSVPSNTTITPTSTAPGTYWQPITVAGLTALSSLPTGQAGRTIEVHGATSTAFAPSYDGASGKVLTIKLLPLASFNGGLKLTGDYWKLENTANVYHSVFIRR